MTHSHNVHKIETQTQTSSYIVFTANSRAANIKRRTKTDTDGGIAPQWNEMVSIPIVDCYELMIECFDEDMLTADDLIGAAKVSMLPVFKNGYSDNWITIGAKDKWGSMQAAGELHLVFDFQGPPGLPYPQLVEGVDTFDDSARIDRKRQKELDEEKERQARAEEDLKRQEEVTEETTQVGVKAGAEFDDDEILDAFKFIDMDNNMFIGAAEIRHILICMGELITDEEVDEMIRMIDSDGDGQVSFEEFYEVRSGFFLW